MAATSGGSPVGADDIGFEAQMMCGAQKLGQMFEALKEVMESATVVITDDGMHSFSSDRNDVALIKWTLNRGSFQRWVCKYRYLLKLNVLSLYKAFKMCGKSTHITLRILKNKPEMLYLIMANASSGYAAQVCITSSTPDEDLVQLTDNQFPQHVRMPPTQFQTLVGYLSNFSSEDTGTRKLRIEWFEDTLELSTGNATDATHSRIVLQQTNSGMSMATGMVDPDNTDAGGGEQVDDEDDVGEAPLRDRKRARTSQEQASAASPNQAATAADTAVTSSMMSAETLFAQSQRTPIVEMELLMKYVKYFAKAAPLCQIMRIFLRDNLAMFSFNIGTLGTLQYYICPTMGEDDAAQAADDLPEDYAEVDNNGAAATEVQH